MILDWMRDFAGSRDSLRRRTLAGSNWLMGKSLICGALELVRAAIFARVLFPTDYGLMALAMIAINFLESFSATGIEIMIQRDNEGYREKLDTYWTVRFIRGICLFCLGWFVALPLSGFYENSALIPLVRLVSVTFLFRGVAGLGKEVRQREMAFARVAKVETVATVIELALGLLALFFFRNVWALAAYSLINSLAYAVYSYVLFPRRPRIKFDAGAFKAVAGFAGAITLVNVCNYLFISLDTGAVGKIFGVEEVGYYARANFLAILPATYLASVIAPVFLPAFREIGHDLRRLRAAFTKTLFAHTAFYVILGLALLICSRWIVLLVYGEKWMPSLPAFRILLIYGVSKGIVSVVPPVFYINGKPWLLTFCAGIAVAGLAILCIPLTRAYGIEGTAWAVVISGLIAHFLATIMAFAQLKSPAPKGNHAN